MPFPFRPLTVFLLSALPLAALDLDANNQEDVWEARYGAAGLDPEVDTDGDGQKNAAESLAGTDPFDPNSRFKTDIVKEGSQFRFTVTTQPGKRYQLVSSPSPAGPWNPVGTAVPASAATLEFTSPKSGNHGFFRVVVSDFDTDGDGLNDWAEGQLAGFDPTNADTFGSATAGNDLAVATEIVQALKANSVTITATTATAYEKEATPAVLTFARPTAPNYPFTLFLKKRGATDTTKSSASPDDYSLRDAQNQIVTHRLVIPAGQLSADLSIKPVTDTRSEVPEQLGFALGGSTRTAAVTICDASNIQANQRLLIAYLRPIPGVESVGSGIATVRLQGDNDLATVTVSFSNLASPVNSTQVLNANSSILQSVPPANYGGQTWLIRASQSFTTDQAVLDALLSGGVKLGVLTENNLHGEIEGPFQPTSGSTQFQMPGDPDPIADITGDELDRDIIRFLTQSTYGPTPEAIADLKARVTAANGNRMAAYGAWIDAQFAMPQTLVLPYTIAANTQEIQVRAALPTTDPNYSAAYDPNNANRRRGWWMMALNSPDQLRQRLAFALSQIFVISDTNSQIYERTYGSAHYYDMLGERSTGTYRNLLEGVTLHPTMGYYLSHLRNSKTVYAADGVTVKTSPDENYAREIMQLFSIGLVQLHPDGSLKLGPTGLPISTYGQGDITEMARVFTGWSFSVYQTSAAPAIVPNTKFNQGNGSERFEAQWMAPMAMFQDYHDVGAKNPIGLSIPAGQTGAKDLADVLDYLSNHANTAPFICRRLIQRLTTANPSAGYLYRVSNTFKTTNGNLAATVKAILLDPEVRSTTVPITLASAGKDREPLLRATAFLRALGGKSELKLSDLSAYGYPSEELAKYPADARRARISSTSTTLLENPMSAPTVFNFYSPDYSPAGLLAANGLNSPELLLANDNSVIQGNNFLYNMIYGSLSATNIPDQTQAPYGYTTNGQNLLIGFAPLEALYMQVMDTNLDGKISSADTTFNKPASITAACEAVLNRADLLLCSGGLKNRYGSTPGKPRQIILDAAVSIQSQNNANSSTTNQATYMRDRVKAILWLVSTSPECVIQK